MKITLDISKLLEEGKITKEEFDKLYRLSAQTTGSLAFNILIGFGVVAVCGGALALFQDAVASIVLGVMLGLLGIVINKNYSQQWGLLGNISVLCGSLMLGGGTVVLMEASLESFLLLSLIFGIGGIYSSSGLLVSLAVLSIAAAAGVGTAYGHATYFLWVEKPLVTVVIFSLAATILYVFSKSLNAGNGRLAIIASRTCVFLANLGFWIGSLWGDVKSSEAVPVSPYIFTLAWAVCLLAVGVWAARANLRWTVNIVSVFAAIHLYTQWFGHYGASPFSFLLAGLLAIGIAVAIWKYNQRLIAGGDVRK